MVTRSTVCLPVVCLRFVVGRRWVRLLCRPSLAVVGEVDLVIFERLLIPRGDLRVAWIGSSGCRGRSRCGFTGRAIREGLVVLVVDRAVVLCFRLLPPVFVL